MNRITTAMIAAALISRRDDAAVCNPMASLPDIDVKALVAEYGTEQATPGDAADVGRCVRLLDLAAANGCDWREAIPLGRLSMLCPDWAPLVPRWADIEAAYLEDVVATSEWRRRQLYRKDGVKRVRPLALLPHPPMRSYWLVATLRPGGYDPYRDVVPHPFRVTP